MVVWRELRHQKSWTEPPPGFNPISWVFVDNREIFFEVFAAAFSKLLQLGCGNQPVEESTVVTKEQAEF